MEENPLTKNESSAEDPEAQQLGARLRTLAPDEEYEETVNKARAGLVAVKAGQKG